MRRDDELPENGLDDFLALREKPDIMCRFSENILRCVVGRREWKDGVGRFMVRDLATVTDEAFGLLVLENIWDAWMEVPVEEYFAPKKRGEKRKREVRTGKYTKDSKRASKFKGWSKDGLKRMNQLIAMVKEDREKNKDWDEGYLEVKRKHIASSKKKGTESGGMEEDVTVVIDELD